MKKLILVAFLATLFANTSNAANCDANPRNASPYEKAVACSLNARNKIGTENNKLLLKQNAILTEIAIQLAIIANEARKEN